MAGRGRSRPPCPRGRVLRARSRRWRRPRGALRGGSLKLHLARTTPSSRRSPVSLAKRMLTVVTLLAVLAPAAGAVVVKEERVPGGWLELTWSRGFGVGRVFTPLALPAGDPAIPSPSGDNTVAVLQNVATGLGGIALSATDPSGFSDYTWESDFFTGAGSTRVGLILRADPTDGVQTFYQFVINPGLFLLRFRQVVAGAPLA